MSLSKSYIESRLNSVKSKKELNDSNCAQSHPTSLVYQQDITNNESKFSNIENAINTFKSAISNVSNQASSAKTNFTNTSANLQSLNGSVSTSEIDSIKDKIEKKSLEVFNELKTLYDNNYKNWDSTVSVIEDYLNKYDTLESKVDSLESEINSIKSSAEDASEFKKLKSLKNDYESRMSTYLSNCNSKITELESMNSKNDKVLSDGLKKV
ncbi:MAG: hypothetical protein IKN63_04660 [Bacilli bacterium]|nr:hypothetical protein [Bacilli bacterium]